MPDPTPTPTPCPEVLRLLPDRDPVPCRGTAGHPGLHYHEHPGIRRDRILLVDEWGPGPMLPRALEVSDGAVDRLADALDLGRLDDETPLLEVVAETLAAAYDSTTFATAARLIDELENAGYRIRPIAGLDR